MKISFIGIEKSKILLSLTLLKNMLKIYPKVNFFYSIERAKFN